jgi:glutamate-1-semialdehyde 2,1-aminomutase
MAAGYATLLELLKPGFYEELEQKTAQFTAILEKYCTEKGYALRFPHVGSIFWPTFSENRIQRADEIDGKGMDLFKIMHLECLKRGVYFGPSGYEVGFISAAHTQEDLDFAIEMIKESIDITFS